VLKPAKSEADKDFDRPKHSVETTEVPQDAAPVVQTLPFPEQPPAHHRDVVAHEKPANEQYRPARKFSNKPIRKSTSRGSRSRRDKDSWMLNSRSVAKLMHIKQKIRGEHQQQPEPVMIDDKPASRAFDELHEQHLQS